jgi:hypothetical protein
MLCPFQRMLCAFLTMICLFLGMRCLFPVTLCPCLEMLCSFLATLHAFVAMLCLLPGVLCLILAILHPFLAMYSASVGPSASLLIASASHGRPNERSTLYAKPGSMVGELETLSTNMLWGEKCDVAMAVHTEQAPSDGEWDGWIELCAKRTPNRLGFLIFSDGGGPSGVQRSKLSRIPELKMIPSAVVTSSAIGRGIVTAVAWLGTKVRAFAPLHVRDALDFLRVPEERRYEVLREVASLRMRLVGSTLDSFETGSPDLSGVGQVVDFVLTEKLARIREKTASK